MWVCIMGPEGTGKNVIADILTKRNFQKIEFPRYAKDENLNELDFATKRLNEQMQAQTMMNKRDIFTMRSVWDTVEVMAPTSDFMMRMGAAERDALKILSHNVFESELLEPPHCVVWTKLDRRSIQDRLLLAGRQPNDDEISKQLELYEKFVERIRIPVLEIDMSKSPIDVRDELNFSIDSMKATSLSSQTIWKRKFYHN